MAQVLKDLEKYVSDFRTFEKTAPANGASWVQDIREHGLSRFRDLGFPTARRGNEKWKYTNVGPIASATFDYLFEAPARTVTPAALQPLVPWDDEWARLVFVDGRFSEELSKLPAADGGVRAGNLAEALASDRELVEPHLARYVGVEDDAFAALNTAFLRDGAFLYLPGGTSLEAPLHLVFVTTEQERPTVSYPRTLIVLGQHAELKLVESYAGLAGSRYFTDAVAEIVVGEGAQVDHYRYLRESPSAFHIGATKVYQHRDSTFTSITFEMGCEVARNDIHVLLDDPGASCVLNGLYMTSGAQHVDNEINIDHIKPHCSSSQYWKGILAGRSHAVYSGRVVVHKDAQKTYATQADKNLLLSRNAEIDTKPSLFIYADDVQATHGATAGHIDEDAFFYLRSRGLDAETASRLLINGFAREIIDTVKLDAVRHYLDRLTSSSLPDFKFTDGR
jgi:Fe-S cluster assembly protein SufD